LSANFTSKSVFGQQGCRALTFALARLSCHKTSYFKDGAVGGRMSARRSLLHL